MRFSAIFLVAAASVHALPQLTTSRPPLPSYYLWANGTRTSQYYPPELRSSSQVKRDIGKYIRQEAGRCDIQVGGNDVVAQDLNAGPDEFPQAFAQLFDNLASDLCDFTSCDADAEYCVTASTGADICIKALGFFERQSRDAFIRSTRGSFDRAVRRVRPGQGVIETGPDFVSFQARAGPLGIGDLRVDLRNVDKESGGGGCGPVIETIAIGGQLFPQVAAPFGALSFFCGAFDTFSGTATGE